VVLFCFLFFAGLGSLMAGKVATGPTNRLRNLMIMLCVLALVFTVVVIPWMTSLLHLSLPMRILVAVVLLAPLNLLMGLPFPTALARLKESGPGLVPWAIGANGGASVVASVLAPAIAMEGGFLTVSFTAIAAYLLAAFVAVGRPAPS